jgi:hypothetical protein
MDENLTWGMLKWRVMSMNRVMGAWMLISM